MFTFIFNISLNTLIPAIAEEDYLIFLTGEGEQRVERRLKKSQVTTERLAQMIGVSHNAEALTVGSLSNGDGNGNSLWTGSRSRIGRRGKGEGKGSERSEPSEPLSAQFPPGSLRSASSPLGTVSPSTVFVLSPTVACSQATTATKMSPENIPLFHMCYLAIISSRSTFTKMANYSGIKLVGVSYKLTKSRK